MRKKSSKKNEKPSKKSEKPVSKQILVEVGPVEKRIVILENNELVDFFMERESLEHYAGSIYKGKVSAILPGIEAAFVDIGMGKNGFLHVNDVTDKSAVLREMLSEGDEPDYKTSKKGKAPKIGDILTKGEERMVQVVKEAISTKGPRLTTYISIPGRYIVLTPYDSNIGISRRITDRDERKRIRSILSKMGILGNCGCIVRTVAENCAEKELASELKYLMSLWSRIKGRSEKQAAPVSVYEEYGVVLRIIRDFFTNDVEKLTVDSKEEYARISKFLKAFMPELRKKVKLYNGKTPLFQKANLSKKLDQIFERKVALNCGGSLVIEQTEGVVVIDVNTGSFVGKRSLEETAYKANLEAAEEIPRQLLLRDIGGIIIIDFIDMETKTHRDKIYNMLQKSLKADKARINLREISEFGVVEMTRQRMRKSLEGSSHIECPYCGGKGMIKSAETIAIEAARRIDNMLIKSTKKQKVLKVRVHPDINAVFISNQAKILGDIQRKYRCKIEITADRSLHIEDIVLEMK